MVDQRVVQVKENQVGAGAAEQGDEFGQSVDSPNFGMGIAVLVFAAVDMEDLKRMSDFG